MGKEAVRCYNGTCGHHRHDYDYVIVPISGGTFLITESGGTTREMTQKAAVAYLGRAGTEHDVEARQVVGIRDRGQHRDPSRDDGEIDHPPQPSSRGPHERGNAFDEADVDAGGTVGQDRGDGRCPPDGLQRPE